MHSVVTDGCLYHRGSYGGSYNKENTTNQRILKSADKIKVIIVAIFIMQLSWVFYIQAIHEFE